MKRNSTGWVVAFAALGVNLVLGILYSWSVIAKELVVDPAWGWSNTQAQLPYTFCVATFAFMMIFAGRAQDKYGPKLIALLGGVLFGVGLIASAFAKNPTVMVLTFGIIGGMGIGFGYSAVTPCAIKWFEPSKKGVISGIVVSGVGLSPVYIAPLTSWLLKMYSIEQTFLYLGIFALVVISVFALILRNPPQGYVPQSSAKSSGSTSVAKEYTWQEMLRTTPFYLLWLSYLMSAAAGLMLIGHMARIASVQASWQAGFQLVIILSVFNALGRVIGGTLSDKMGRVNAMLLVFLIQAANMFAFSYFTSITSLSIGAAIAGLSYGALFALFPATTADFFGVKNLGVNYGLVFSGWGVAGIIGPIIGGLVADATGTYNISYVVAGAMLIVGALIIKMAKAPVRQTST